MSISPHLRIMLSISRATLLESRRTRFPLLLGLITLLGVVLSQFAGALAITEGASITAMVLGGYLRLAVIMAMALFVLTSQSREQQEKGMQQLLSLEVPRSVYLFGKLLGHLWIHLAVALLLTLLMLAHAAPLPALAWGLSLFCEMSLISTLALLCHLTFRHVPVSFAALCAFYLLARSLTTLRLVGDGPIMPGNALSVTLMAGFLDGLAFLLPDLARFTRSAWLIQERSVEWLATLPQELGFIAMQTVIYSALLIGVALVDLYRKQF